MRDVIRVERHLDALESSPGATRTVSHTLDEALLVDGGPLEALGRVADEVLPPLVARLAVSGLGELEVRHDGWHVRLRRAPTAGLPEDHPSGGPTRGHEPTPGHDPASVPARASLVATSPSVGYFQPHHDLAVGARLAQGDLLGWINVLGVRQEVTAPLDGLVGKLLAGPGDPVEYGQELVQLVPAGSAGAAPTGGETSGDGAIT